MCNGAFSFVGLAYTVGMFSSLIFVEAAKKALRNATIDPIDPIHFKSVLTTEITPNIDGYNLTYVTGAARLGRYATYYVRYNKSVYHSLVGIINLRSQLRIIVVHYGMPTLIPTKNLKTIGKYILRADPQHGGDIHLTDETTFLPLYRIGSGQSAVFFGSFTIVDCAYGERKECDYYKDHQRAFSDFHVLLAIGADLVLDSAYRIGEEEHKRRIYNLYALKNQSSRFR